MEQIAWNVGKMFNILPYMERLQHYGEWKVYNFYWAILNIALLTYLTIYTWLSG